jgi:hypothetical protein
VHILNSGTVSFHLGGELSRIEPGDQLAGPDFAAFVNGQSLKETLDLRDPTLPRRRRGGDAL